MMFNRALPQPTKVTFTFQDHNLKQREADLPSSYWSGFTGREHPAYDIQKWLAHKMRSQREKIKLEKAVRRAERKLQEEYDKQMLTKKVAAEQQFRTWLKTKGFANQAPEMLHRQPSPVRKVNSAPVSSEWTRPKTARSLRATVSARPDVAARQGAKPRPKSAASTSSRTRRISSTLDPGRPVVKKQEPCKALCPEDYMKMRHLAGKRYKKMKEEKLEYTSEDGLLRKLQDLDWEEKCIKNKMIYSEKSDLESVKVRALKKKRKMRFKGDVITVEVEEVDTAVSSTKHLALPPSPPPAIVTYNTSQSEFDVALGAEQGVCPVEPTAGARTATPAPAANGSGTATPTNGSATPVPGIASPGTPIPGTPTPTSGTSTPRTPTPTLGNGTATSTSGTSTSTPSSSPTPSTPAPAPAAHTTNGNGTATTTNGNGTATTTNGNGTATTTPDTKPARPKSAAPPKPADKEEETPAALNNLSKTEVAPEPAKNEAADSTKNVVDSTKETAEKQEAADEKSAEKVTSPSPISEPVTSSPTPISQQVTSHITPPDLDATDSGESSVSPTQSELSNADTALSTARIV